MTEVLITSSVLITAITALRALLKDVVSARLVYALWLVAALRLMLPFSLAPSPVSVMNAAPETVFVLSEDVPLQQDNTAYVLPTPGYTAQAGEAAQEPASTQESSATSGAAEPNKPGIDLPTALRTLRIAGTAALAVYFAAVNSAFYFRLRSTRRRLETPGSAIPVYLADTLQSPCLTGIFRPAVYLTPASLESKERAQMVILHEETHYRHGDHLWSLVRCVLLCAYWYDPFVWLAAYLSRRDAELACDESCIRALGRGRRIEYGRALIDLLDCRAKKPPLLSVSTSMSGDKRTILKRVERIARAPKTRWAAVVLAVLLVFATAACTFTGADRPDSVQTTPERAGVSQVDAASIDIVPLADSGLTLYNTADYLPEGARLAGYDEAENAVIYTHGADLRAAGLDGRSDRLLMTLQGEPGSDVLYSGGRLLYVDGAFSGYWTMYAVDVSSGEAYEVDSGVRFPDFTAVPENICFDGRYAVYTGQDVYTESKDQVVRLFDMDSMQLITIARTELNGDWDIMSAALGDGFVAYDAVNINSGYSLFLYDMETGETQELIRGADLISTHASGDYLAIMLSSGGRDSMAVYDWDSGEWRDFCGSDTGSPMMLNATMSMSHLRLQGKWALVGSVSDEAGFYAYNLETNSAVELVRPDAAGGVVYCGFHGPAAWWRAYDRSALAADSFALLM